MSLLAVGNLVTALNDYLADWKEAACTWNGREVSVSGGLHLCGFEELVWREQGQAGGKTSPLSLTDTSIGPSRCNGLH